MIRSAILLVCIVFAFQLPMKGQDKKFQFGISLDFQQGNLSLKESPTFPFLNQIHFASTGIGIILEKNIFKNISLSLVPKYQITTYDFDFSLTGIYLIEKKHEINLPLHLNFKFEIAKVHPVFSLGYGFTILDLLDNLETFNTYKNYHSLSTQIGFSICVEKFKFYPFIGFEKSLGTAYQRQNFTAMFTQVELQDYGKTAFQLGLRVGGVLFEKEKQFKL